MIGSFHRFYFLFSPRRDFVLMFENKLETFKPLTLAIVKELNINIMKKLILLIPAIALMMPLKTNAQRTPVIDAREQNQRARIHEGVETGTLTHAEASRLRSEERHIKRSERRAKADGKVTRGERARIEHKQDRVSHDIRRQKHDRQKRNKTT